MFDPILGPKGPKEECFVNGDDKRDPLGIGRDRQLGGLNPTDVGVEYTIGGKRRVTTSNDGLHLLAAVHDPPRGTASERR